MERILKAPLYSALALLIYTPFHVFLAQWLSTYTGSLEVWKGAKDVFLLAALALTYGLLVYKKVFSPRYFWVLTGCSLAYFLIHLLVWYANPGIDIQAALLGTAYNCRLFGYALLAWGAMLLYPGKFPLKKAFQIALIISSVAALLGIIQLALPKDIMTHFGYSIDRGVKPAFFIDDKANLPRIMSTLRDPNSLGAFLILPITALALAWTRLNKARMFIGGLLLLHVWALLLTFSRSAWLGTLLAVALALGWTYRAKLLVFARKYAVFLAVGVFVLVLGTFLLRDQYFVQNVVFHSDENTTLTDPNELRTNFYKQTAEEVGEQPFGHGPGTAGLVSIQTEKVVLTENYFLQIAYEVGIQGLALLMALIIFIAKLLFDQKNAYSTILLASLAGLSVSAMLLHTWSNEAIAAQWFTLAGIALGAFKWKQAGSLAAGHATKARRSR